MISRLVKTSCQRDSERGEESAHPELRGKKQIPRANTALGKTDSGVFERFLGRRRITGVLVFCAIVAMPFLAARALAQHTERAKEIGGKFMCMCGCNEVLTQCNHVGCQTSAAMLKEIDDAVARGETETAITQMLVLQYGTAVYAEPPKSGFSLVAWSMPTVYLVLGLGLVIFVISRWRKRGMPAAAAAGATAQGPAVSPELLERARAEAEKETED